VTGPDPIERWLAGQHRTVRDGLGHFLDSGAGLRETAIYSKHTALLSGLAGSLDPEAGLAAILPASAAAAISSADPGIRMVLRRHPVILTVILSDLLVRALVIAKATACGQSARQAADSIHDFDGALDQVRDLDDAIRRARDLDDAVFRARCTIPRQQGPWAMDIRTYHDNGSLSVASSRVRQLARHLTANFHQARDPDPGRAELSRELDDALQDVSALARILDHDLQRDFDRHLASASYCGCAQSFALALDPAREIARSTALVVRGVLGARRAEGLAAALLAGMLDDFTHADLSHADLGGLALTGVRWSASGTVWPPGTDVDALRARSWEVTPGTGIYVVAGPDDGSDRDRRGVSADR
jgi:hypothetical protein